MAGIFIKKKYVTAGCKMEDILPARYSKGQDFVSVVLISCVIKYF